MEKACTDYSIAKKEYGEIMAEKISQRIGELKAADSVEMLLKYAIGDCHKLKGDRKNQYAMSLAQPYRLLFKQKEQSISVIVIEITDYH